VGVFEVGLALGGKQELGLSQVQIATMFTECRLVMIVVQSVVFSPWLKPETTRWLIASALGCHGGRVDRRSVRRRLRDNAGRHRSGRHQRRRLDLDEGGRTQGAKV
jgi:hypothetical protein